MVPVQVPQGGPVVIHGENLSIRVAVPEYTAHWIKSTCDEPWTSGTGVSSSQTR